MFVLENQISVTLASTALEEVPCDPFLEMGLGLAVRSTGKRQSWAAETYHVSSCAPSSVPPWYGMVAPGKIAAGSLVS